MACLAGPLLLVCRKSGWGVCSVMSVMRSGAAAEALKDHRDDETLRVGIVLEERGLRMRQFLAALTPLAAEARPHADAMPFAA